MGNLIELKDGPLKGQKHRFMCVDKIFEHNGSYIQYTCKFSEGIAFQDTEFCWEKWNRELSSAKADLYKEIGSFKIFGGS